MDSIVDVLTRRDGLEKEEAEAQVNDFRHRFADGEISVNEVEDELMSEFGVEPDYIFELLFD